MKLNKLNITLFTLIILAFSGCKDEDIYDNDFDNKLFITGESSFKDNMIIKAGIAGYTREITLGIAKPLDQNVEIEIGVAPELLDHYRMAYYAPEAILLSENFYTIKESKTTIEVGNVKSAPIVVEFVNVDQLSRDEVYVLPVTLRTVTGIEVLESARTMYYAFKAGALINVVADIEKNACKVNWTTTDLVSSMSAITMEALVRARYFTRSTSDSEITSIMGIEGVYLLRCGDANGAGQLQVATGSGNFPGADASKALSPNKWLHIAVSHDLVGGDYVIYVNGVKESEGNKSFGFLNLTSSGKDGAGFHIGRSWNDNRWWPGEISEVRIWNRVLTASEIAASNHFYSVDPTSDGLVAYWKFDEGTGEVVKDHTNGNNLTASNPLKWSPITLPE